MSHLPVNADGYIWAKRDIWEYIRQTLAHSNNLGDEGETDNYEKARETVRLLNIARQVNPEAVETDLLGAELSESVDTLLECVFMLKPDIADYIEELLQRVE
jgi:hypothetical protein